MSKTREQKLGNIAKVNMFFVLLYDCCVCSGGAARGPGMAPVSLWIEKSIPGKNNFGPNTSRKIHIGKIKNNNIINSKICVRKRNRKKKQIKNSKFENHIGKK